jgi:hypothetical protein
MKTITIDGVKYNLTPIENQSKPIILEQHLKFEVYSEDLGEHNWEDAKKVCEDLGDGWRLPTREELHFMWINRRTVGDFANNYYWSYSEVNSKSAWYQDFSTGRQSNNYKNDICYVRAVRDITI